jgi:hypothetical protein
MILLPPFSLQPPPHSAPSHCTVQCLLLLLVLLSSAAISCYTTQRLLLRTSLPHCCCCLMPALIVSSTAHTTMMQLPFLPQCPPHSAHSHCATKQPRCPTGMLVVVIVSCLRNKFSIAIVITTSSSLPSNTIQPRKEHCGLCCGHGASAGMKVGITDDDRGGCSGFLCNACFVIFLSCPTWGAGWEDHNCSPMGHQLR